MPASLPLVALTLTLLSQAEPATPVAPTQAESCRAETLADLRRCLSANDLLLVATTGQDLVRGRYKGIVNGQLLVETGAIPAEPVRIFSDDDVVEVAVLRARRRMADVARVGISGGLIGALLGTEAPDWETYGILVAAVSGISAVTRMVAPLAYPEPVYTRAGAGQPTQTIAETFALGATAPVSFDELGQRIQSGQHIRLRDTSHAVMLGRFAGVESDQLVIRIGNDMVRVRESEIQVLQRRVRAFPSRRRVAAVGAAVTTALLAVSWAITTPQDRSRDPLTPAIFATGAVMGAVVGVGLAETLGRHRYETVVLAPRKHPGLALRF